MRRRRASVWRWSVSSGIDLTSAVCAVGVFAAVLGCTGGIVYILADAAGVVR